MNSPLGINAEKVKHFTIKLSASETMHGFYCPEFTKNGTHTQYTKIYSYVSIICFQNYSEIKRCKMFISIPYVKTLS